MKKLLILLIVYFLIISSAMSQQYRSSSHKDSKGYVALSLGLGIPLGDFASTDLQNENAGLALGGGVFDISFAYLIGKQFGISAALKGQSWAVDAQGVANELAQIDPTASWEVESTPWGAGGLWLGPYGSFEVSTKTNLELRAQLGFITATSPEMTITASSGATSSTATQLSSTGSTIAYLIGIGFKVNLGKSKRVCFLSHMDYTSMEPEFTVIAISPNSPSNSSTFSQKMDSFSITFGIGINF